MNKKQTIPALVAGTILGAGAGAPMAFAAAQDDLSEAADQQQTASGMSQDFKDGWLDGKLETVLLFNEHLNSFTIDTEVRNGVAYLDGAVESDIDRDLAGEIAQSIDGIVDVKNNLVVDRNKAAASRDAESSAQNDDFKQKIVDATLTARIKSELLVNTNTAGLAIDVDSRNGQVTLSGEVESEEEKSLAEKIAENTNGARTVDNRLTVVQESSS